MDPFVINFLWFIGSFLFGVMLGCMTGLIPGFHVNNVALLAVSMAPLAIGVGIPLDAVAGTIVATGTVHTFLNYIPSALVGAPDGDTALALLPGHRMLISGQAAQGVAYSARGSQMGMFLSVPLLVVARLLFGTNPGLGLYDASREILPWLLLVISTFLILTETTRLPWPVWMQKMTARMRWEFRKPLEFTIPFGHGKINRRYESLDLRLGNASRICGMLAATAFFLLSGFYGWAVFELPARSPVGIPSASLLMPGLAGLFGIANLIDIYVTTSEMPPQEPNWEMPAIKPLAVPTFLSAICSAVMAILPGMTAAQATVVVMTVRNLWGKFTDPNYIPADFEYGPGMRDFPRPGGIAAAGAGAGVGTLAVGGAAVAATTAVARRSTQTDAGSTAPVSDGASDEDVWGGESVNGGVVSGEERAKKGAIWKGLVMIVLPSLLMWDAFRSREYVCEAIPFGNPITVEGVSIQPTHELCSMLFGQTTLGISGQFQIALVIAIVALGVLLHFLEFGKLVSRRFVNSPPVIDSAGGDAVQDESGAIPATEIPAATVAGVAAGGAVVGAATAGGLSAADLAIFDGARGEAFEAAETSPDLDLDAHSHQQDLEVIAVLSSVNTSVTVMVLGFLYMVGRPRSGAALALNMMYPIDIWNSYEPPADFVRLLAITIGSGLIAVPIMLKVGKGMLKLHEMIPLRTMVGTVILFVSALVWFSTGWIGVGVLIIGTVMGLMPPRIGIRRSHGMGIILVPIMIYTFASQLDSFGFI